MVTENDQIDLGLIHRAQQDQADSRTRLAQAAEVRVYAYIYRMTFDRHLAEDLTQETLLEMIRSLPTLHFKAVAPFWGWLYRTALSKVQRYFSAHGNRRLNRNMVQDSDGLDRYPVEEMGGLNKIIQEELLRAIARAMNALNACYRSVLLLRCFDQMSYTDIAAIMGGTNVQAKLLFFRAKQSLKRQLKRNGFEQSYLIPALGLFGAATLHPGKASAGAAAINAGTLEVGVGTAVLATATSKLVVSLVGASVILGFAGTAIHQQGSPSTTHSAQNLLYDPCFVAPTRVVAAHDPDMNGWQYCRHAENSSPHLPTTPHTILIETPFEQERTLVVPPKHWVEVGFDRPLADAPGPDLFFAGWGCVEQRVFVTDGADRIHKLPTQTCLGRPHDYHVVPLDLASLSLDFEPRAIRFFNNLSPDSRVMEFYLHTIRARQASSRSVSENVSSGQRLSGLRAVKEAE
ncbi:RNA polymerase sigma factor [Planctomycetota bacterium]